MLNGIYNPKAIHLAQAQLEIMVNSGIARYHKEELETLFKAMYACMGHVIKLGDKVAWDSEKMHGAVYKSIKKVKQQNKRKLLK